MRSTQRSMQHAIQAGYPFGAPQLTCGDPLPLSACPCCCPPCPSWRCLCAAMGSAKAKLGSSARERLPSNCSTKRCSHSYLEGREQGGGTGTPSMKWIKIPDKIWCFSTGGSPTDTAFSARPTPHPHPHPRPRMYYTHVDHRHVVQACVASSFVRAGHCTPAWSRRPSQHIGSTAMVGTHTLSIRRMMRSCWPTSKSSRSSICHATSRQFGLISQTSASALLVGPHEAWPSDRHRHMKPHQTSPTSTPGWLAGPSCLDAAVQVLDRRPIELTKLTNQIRDITSNMLCPSSPRPHRQVVHQFSPPADAPGRVPAPVLRSNKNTL